jgi:hypothetical protein
MRADFYFDPNLEIRPWSRSKRLMEVGAVELKEKDLSNIQGTNMTWLKHLRRLEKLNWYSLQEEDLKKQNLESKNFLRK